MARMLSSWESPPTRGWTNARGAFRPSSWPSYVVASKIVARTTSAARIVIARRSWESGSTSPKAVRCSVSCVEPEDPPRRYKHASSGARTSGGPSGSSISAPRSCQRSSAARTYNPLAVNPVSATATIARPREEVFEYLADVANHAEFTDHYLVSWRLLREDTYGVGAGARFRIKAPFNRFAWADVTIAEIAPPYRIVEHGRGGKFNRVRMLGIYTLSPGAGGTTRVEYTFETDPQLLSDRLMEGLGGARWIRRQIAKSLRRLRVVLEEGRDRGRRPSVAAR
jgi:uncharacterized protein YndB with AHSA1/START domain